MPSRIDWGGLAFPKENPDHAPGRREQLHADYPVLRPKVREDTFIRDGGRCRCPCARVLWLRTDDHWMLANIHETEKPREEAAIDVTLRSTITLADGCHKAVERNKLKIRYLDDDLRCNGPVEFTGRLANGKILTEPYISEPTLSGPWRRD